MHEVTVLIKFLDPDPRELSVPEYATVGSSGFDLVASRPASLAPGHWCLVSTGIAVSVPYGYELQIRSRSGVAAQKGLVVLNQPGTLDSDYRGEVGVILLNLSAEGRSIKPGDRIAQGVICPVARAKFVVAKELDQTERGVRGHGSTGERN